MRKVTRVSLGLALPAAIVATYWVWSSLAPSPFFPPIGVILDRFGELWFSTALITDVLPSLINLFVGLAIGLAVGFLLGLTMGRVRWLHDAALPLVTLGRSVPPIMLIPPLILILGIGDLSKVAIIAFGALFPMCLATIDGVRRPDSALIDVARSMQLSRGSALREIILPSAGPSMFGGAQIALQIAFVLMVASEMLAAVRGLGFITMQAQLSFDAVTMWAGILLLAIIGLSVNLIFVLIRTRVLAWHYGKNRS